MKENKLFKRLVIFAIAALMLISVANVASAAHVEMGNSASTSYESYVPFYGFYDFGWSAVIYLQSELGGTKDLNGLTYDVYDSWTGAPYTIYDQKVYMKHTTLTDWVGDYAKPDPTADGYTLVYEGDITFTGIGFADFIPLDTNFNYDGTSNLIIYWENWDGDYVSGQPRWQYPGSSYAPNRVKYRYADNAMPGDATSASYYFPNIRIHYPGTHDVAVTDIVSPEAAEGYGNVPVTVEVKNTGLNTETFPVNVKINSPPITLLDEGFEGTYSTRPYLPPGWLWEDTNLDGTIYSTYTNNMWGTYYSSTYAHTGTMSVREEDCYSPPWSDDWLFTPHVILNAGQTYTLDWWSRCSSASYPLTSMEVFIGSAQFSGAMTTWLWSDPSMTHTTHQQDFTTFTVPVTGSYVIGFWVNSPSSSDADIYLDDIMLYIPGSTIYDQTVTMTNLGSGSTSEANLPDWVVASPGVYEVIANAQLATDVALYDNIKIKNVEVGLVDASLDSIDIPRPLMGPAPFDPKATVNNTGDLDFSLATVGLLPVHATVLDPSGGTGLCFEEDFEGATGVSEFEGDVELEFNPMDVTHKYGDYVGAYGYILWPDDETPLGSPDEWTILNPDNNGALWHVTDYRSSPASPVQSMYHGDEITKQYLPDSTDIMISPKIHVGNAGGSFSFDIYNDVEGGGWDDVYFGASPDGMTWNFWFGGAWWMTWYNSGAVPIFPTDVDVNGDCYVAFLFLSDNSYQYEGAYIDNVKVQGSPYLYDETVYVDLVAGDELEVEFPTFTPLDGYEDYTIDICCESPDDTVPANDCDSLAFTTGAPVYILETGYGYLTIQDGIDAAEIGQTVVATDGAYPEDIVIYKDITVTGENPPTSTAIIYGTVDIVADGVTFQNFKVIPGGLFTADEAGIFIAAGNVLVQDNIIEGMTGEVTDTMFTIKGIHVYGGGPDEFRNIVIQNNIIRNIVNTNLTGGGGGCAYEICLEDTYGDGWNGGKIDVYVNGAPVHMGLTVPSGYGPVCEFIPVANGDTILLDYTYLSYPSENYWELSDNDGIVVFSTYGGSSNTAYDHTETASGCPSTTTYTYGGADGIMVQGYVKNVELLDNTITDIHSAGWCYGVEVTPTASAIFDGSFADVFYESDFESDDGGWVATASWDPVGDWEWTDSYDYSLYTGGEQPPTAAHSGDGLWGTVVHGDYTNSGGFNYLSQTFDFSGLEGITLSWYEWVDIFGYFDYGEVFVNGDLVYYVDTYPGDSWDLVTIDLSAYEDLPSVEIEFSLYCTTVVAYAGWYIDDVLIEVESGMTPPQPVPQKIDVIGNYFKAIGDGSVYDVWDSGIAPYPGVMFTLDETYPGADDGDATEVELHENIFDNDCSIPILAVINKDTDGVLKADMNYWGNILGPGSYVGPVYDAITGDLADADDFSCSIVNLGPVHFMPFVGIDAVATLSSLSVETGEPIVFTGVDSFAADFDGVYKPDYYWTFGDGLHSEDETIGHSYGSPGTYNGYLRVKGQGLGPVWPNFMYDWAHFTVTVTAPGAPLSANADGGNLGGYETVAGQTLSLYGVASGGKEPYIFNWDFGNGDTAITEGQEITTTYKYEGVYTATLTVSDSNGDTATDTAQVNVLAVDEMIASACGPYNGVPIIPIFFYSDVIGGTGPFTYTWDFGDGTLSDLESPTHTYDEVGAYTLTLTIEDSLGQIDTDTTIVTVEVEEDGAIIGEIQGGLGVKTTITAGSEPVDWTISIDGRVFMGGSASGSISAGSTEAVRLPFSLGFGNVDITITANSISKECTAFMIGPFVLVK